MNNDSDELLSFKEFPPIETHNQSGIAQININSPKRNVGGTGDPLEDLINDMSTSVKVMQDESDPTKDRGDNSKIYSFWSIEYYQQFFNVDTVMVIDRIATSMIPKRASTTYLKAQIGSNPDLYGPFWIVVTLIFSIAISGNLASYLQNASSDYHWRYNFHLVSYSATAIILYACFVPMALWAAFKWSIKAVDPDLETDMSSYTPSLLSLLCVYGYSLAIYIPVSILWVIQISVLQWLLVITAAFLSGSVLIFIMTPALRNSKFSLFLVIGIIAAHFLLATGFMLYFFHVPSSAEILPTVVTKVATKVATEAVLVNKTG